MRARINPRPHKLTSIGAPPSTKVQLKLTSRMFIDEVKSVVTSTPTTLRTKTMGQTSEKRFLRKECA